MPEIVLTDIPKHLIDDATRRIGNFLVGFVRLSVDVRGHDGNLAGSGTLVRISDTYGILTARHVLDSLPTTGKIGLILPQSSHEPIHPMRPLISAESTRLVGFDRGSDQSEGPDLALLVLAPSDVHWLRARKSFFNLRHWHEEIVSDQRDVISQLYALSGFPHERTSSSGPQTGFSEVKEFKALSLFGFVESPLVVNDFDYVEIPVSYGDGSGNSPQSFEGYSGGGIWKIVLTGDSQDDIRAETVLLSGVAFYQSALVNNQRRIKCHWRQSIYERLVPRVISSMN